MYLRLFAPPSYPYPIIHIYLSFFLFFLFYLSNSQFFLLLDPSKTTARAIHLIFDIVKYDVFDRFFLS